MPISNNILAGASGQGGGYEIERSLRFNSGDSAYLNRTPSAAGNRKTWTWSGWVKRTDINGAYQTIFSAGGSGAEDQLMIWDDETISFYLDAARDGWLQTTQLLRDPAAWYHIVLSVDTTQSTASNRVKIYINGVQVTAFATNSYPVQNYQTFINNNIATYIGQNSANSTFLNGYLADVHFIDGQALDSSSFGETDDNGVWQPKKYSGSYGTNGFHLDFKDNSSNAALGTDTSGNSNTWTVNNLSVAAGANNDSLVDSPTNGTQTDTGAGGEVVGNYATLNPLHQLATATLANGNLQTTSSNPAFSTFLLKSGKWYCEHTSTAGGSYNLCFSQIDHPSGATPSDSNSKSIGWYGGNGYVYWGAGSSSSLGGTTMTGLDGSGYMQNYGVNDILGAAIDMDNSTIKFYKNGTEVGSIDFSTGTAWRFTEGMYVSQFNGTGHFNFGQRAFANSNVPSGYKSLNTANLPEPTIADGSKYFDTKVWSGTGSSQAITGYDFSPDFAWIKRRNATASHMVFDTIRTATKGLHTDSTQAEFTDTTTLTAFNTDGFTLGGHSYSNASGGTYAGWAWDAGTSTVTNNDGSITTNVRTNASAGFSIIGYTGNGTVGATIGHNLNSKPEFFIFKVRSDSGSWYTYHKSYGATKYLTLDRTHGAVVNAYLNNTEPTSSIITLKNTHEVNGAGQGIICYAWTSIPGYSSVGSYTGNGDASGPFVFTGFKPAWILYKRSDVGGNDWTILDSTRGPSNVIDEYLQASNSNAEASTTMFDFLSNGFKPRLTSAGHNASGGTYVYFALAENPFKTARAR